MLWQVGGLNGSLGPREAETSAGGSRAGTRRPREKCYATETRTDDSMQLLRLQAITRSHAIQAGSGLKSLDVEAEAPSMVRLIREAQRTDTYCQEVVEAL